ncbi:MAG: hypothetical protein SNJ84_09815, partial [Verrucomicrobiia bacterium]
MEPDSYLWLLYARQIIEGDEWRVRFTHADNAPFGREVHWSQSVSWSLALLGRVRAWIHPDESMRENLERASVWLNGLVFLTFATVVFVSLGKSLGWWVGGAAVLMMSAFGDFLWAFHPLRPDHQTFHLLFGFGSILGVLAASLGFNRSASPDAPTESGTQQRVWFGFSALCTGLGLWVSATVQMFFLLLLAGSVATSLLVIPPTSKTPGSASGPARLWMEWGWISSLTALFFYALEYFPDFPWQRVEVNHPLYAGAAFAVGIGLYHACRIKTSDHPQNQWRSWIIGLICALIVLLPLALLLRGPAEFHTMRTVEMLRFHNFIKEFYTYANFIKDDMWNHFFRSFGLAPLGLLLAPYLMWRLRRQPTVLVWVWVLFSSALALLALGLFQIRWISMFAVAIALLTAVLLAALFRLGHGPFFKNVVACSVAVLLFTQTCLLMFFQTREIRPFLQGRTIIVDLLQAAFISNTAQALARAEPPPRILLADPNYAPAIAYFAGIPTIISFYWENLDGLRAATDILAADDWDQALRIIRERGVTHLLIEPSDYISNYFYFIRHGHYDLEKSKDNLAGAILYDRGPSWLRPDIGLTLAATGRFRYLTESLQHPVLVFRVE